MAGTIEGEWRGCQVYIMYIAARNWYDAASFASSAVRCYDGPVLTADRAPIDGDLCSVKGAVCPLRARGSDEVMPLFMDIHHHVDGLTADAVKGAHEADLKTQEEFGVNYLQYWFDEGSGKVFCLVEAPNAEAAAEVHRRAHGLVADEIVEVKQGS
jgi:uncharacterized protein DUF4242